MDNESNSGVGLPESCFFADLKLSCMKLKGLITICKLLSFCYFCVMASDRIHADDVYHVLMDVAALVIVNKSDRMRSGICSAGCLKVMAGTGDLRVLRLCRHLGSRIGVQYQAFVTYGSHMAVSMAIGLLFLGGGK